VTYASLGVVFRELTVFCYVLVEVIWKKTSRRQRSRRLRAKNSVGAPSGAQKYIHAPLGVTYASLGVVFRKLTVFCYVLVDKKLSYKAHTQVET